MNEIRLEQNPITRRWMVLIHKEGRSVSRSSKAKKKRPLYAKWYRRRRGEIALLRLWE